MTQARLDIEDGYTRGLVLGREDEWCEPLTVWLRPPTGQDKPAMDAVMKPLLSGQSTSAEPLAELLCKFVVRWSLPYPVSKEAMLRLPHQRFEHLYGVICLGVKPTTELGTDEETKPLQEQQEADAKNS